MNTNIFNIKRFALLAKKDALENGKYNLIFSLAMFAIMVIISSFVTTGYLEGSRHTSDANLHYNLTSMATAFFIFAFMFYLSTMMRPMSSKKKRINYLMLPASSLEKFIVRFIPCTLGFVLMFFLCFYLADFVRIIICSIYYPEMKISPIQLSETLINDDNRYAVFNTHLFKMLSSIFAIILSLFIFGTTFWQKNVFIKNFLSVTALAVAFSYIGHKLCILLSEGDNYHENAFLHPKQFFWDTSVIVLIYTLISIFFCVLAYYRFKESEYIERR